jgi:hypothetical protein
VGDETAVPVFIGYTERADEVAPFDPTDQRLEVFPDQTQADQTVSEQRGGVIVTVISTIRDWLARGAGAHKVTLTIDVYVPSFFTGAPRFPQLEVKDAVVVFIDEGTNLDQRVGQQDYAGQRRSYKIYPQREGEFVVPDFAVKVSFTGEDGPMRVPAPAKGGSFQATIPAGARGVDHFLATSSLELQADTDRPLAGLRTGDSFTRTITMTAADAFAMMLPPLAFAPVDGLAVYPAQPTVADSSGGERGEARVAERRESVTYVLQKPGSYRLPASEIAWWDTRAQTLRRATLPELEFAVAAGPEAQAEIPLPEDPGQPKAAPDSWRPLREALRRFQVAARGMAST